MNCTSCGTKTRVIHTRGPDNRHGEKYAKDVHEAMNRYSDDWRARKRVCPKCDGFITTVELPLPDFQYITMHGNGRGDDEKMPISLSEEGATLVIEKLSAGYASPELQKVIASLREQTFGENPP